MLARILDAIAPSSEDFFVEIGPGEGVLTGLLLGRVKKLEAIELDRDLVATLQTKFADKLVVHCADALEFDFARFPLGVRLVGNLPYNISTPLLFHLTRYASRVRDLHFMLQLEVVERMVAAPSTPAYGRLSVSLQARFSMNKLFNVARGAFRPPPKVQSALVRMEPLDRQLRVDEQLLRRAFSARRKMLRNALPEVDFIAVGIDPRLRPENLSPEDYARLSTRSVGQHPLVK